MTPPGLEHFDEAEEVAERAIKSLRRNLNNAQGDIIEAIYDIIGDLKQTNGLINRSPENLRALMRKIPEIDQRILANPELQKAFESYFNTFKQTTGILNNYFTNQGLPVKSYTELTQLLTKNTADALLQNGINGEFRKGIIDTITSHVTNGTPMAKLRKSIAETIADKSLEKYSGQIAHDAIYQYQRQYSQAITQDLGLEHYFYKGTKIATTRGFCAGKVGKAFTKAEVEAWADKEWSGKIEGTTKETIKTNLGGHNCRHLLVPVTKSVYEALK